MRYIYDEKDLNRKTYGITASWAGPYMQKKKILYLHTCEKKIFFPTPLYTKKKIYDYGYEFYFIFQ